VIVGIPKEVKDNEYRVGMVPAGVHQLVLDEQQVLVQRSAGEGSGFSDSEYTEAGATLVASADELYQRSEMIVKVKEPVPEEYPRLRADQIMFSYLHLAPLPELTRTLLEKRVIGVAYETIPDGKGHLPLLTPMSEVAGRMSILVGAYYLQRPYQGRGVLLGGIPGVRPGSVVIIGAGVVGMNALKMAIGLGAQVTIIDLDLEKLRYVDDIYYTRVETLHSNPYAVAEAVGAADLVIGAVLIPGASAPKLIAREMVSQMNPGAVIVDVSVDQGGCCETTRPTTHSEPVYQVNGIQHYCVTNMPGAMPRTSTLGLTNATLPYTREIARFGLQKAIRRNPLLKHGVNTCSGKITCRPVAESQSYEYVDLDEVI